MHLERNIQTFLQNGRQELLMEALPPLNWEKRGSETWGDVIRQKGQMGPEEGMLKYIFKEYRCASKNMGWDLSPCPPTGLVAGG